ncbi:hypothetical protein D3C85_1944200 [compost metagenome]
MYMEIRSSVSTTLRTCGAKRTPAALWSLTGYFTADANDGFVTWTLRRLKHIGRILSARYWADDEESE